VNHRAVYRHFPDKLSLLARVAEDGWKRLASRMKERISGKRRGEASLVASGVAFFLFARDHPSLFRLMGGPRLRTAECFPALSKAVDEALLILMQGFLDTGTDPKVARKRTVVFAAALQGVTLQILQHRYRISPVKVEVEVAQICKMLIKGLR